MGDVIVKGLIRKIGTLYLERKGRLVSAVCPFSSQGETSVKCGEWCPHFGEPTKERALFQLKLSCGHERVFLFDEFDDQRLVPKVKGEPDLEPDGSEGDANGGVPV